MRYMYTVQSFNNARGHSCYKSSYRGTILQRNYRKMAILWSFSCNSFVKFHGKYIGGLVSHNMTVLYPNQFYKGQGTKIFHCTCPAG